MSQVIICNSAQERTECLKRLAELGHRMVGNMSTFENAPAINLYPEQGRNRASYQTLSLISIDGCYDVIPGYRFLSENNAVKNQS